MKQLLLTDDVAHAQVNEVWGALTNERVKQLLLIKTSRRYLTRLARGLQQRSGAEAKYKR
jgi:hypothetical protein